MPAMNYARVAERYDSYVKTTFDVPFFLDEARKAQGQVLELMSGTGRVSLPLIEAGIPLTCVDNSPDMLAILRQKLEAQGLSAEVYLQDVRELDLPQRYDLIFIPFHSFAELLTEADQRRALERIHAHLTETGRFICTLHNPVTRLQGEDGLLRLMVNVPLDDGKTLLLWKLGHFIPATRTVKGMQFYEEYDAQGIMTAKTALEIEFALLEKDEFENMAYSAGFTITALYGDYAYGEFQQSASPFMIWELAREE